MKTDSATTPYTIFINPDGKLFYEDDSSKALINGIVREKPDKKNFILRLFAFVTRINKDYVLLRFGTKHITIKNDKIKVK